MPRSPDPAKRRILLDQVRAYVMRHGLAGLSLRPLARELGTSDRMLLYYFGTKECMVAEALAVDEARPLPRIRDLLDAAGPPEDPAALRRFVEEIWQRFSAPAVRRTFPLYLEIMVANVLHPGRYEPVTRDTLREWTELFTTFFDDWGMPAPRARTEATLLVDAVFGLLMAHLADGGEDQADAAFHMLLDRLEPGWRADLRA
ncbi:TetR/AcrR family transcriptional regulator [Streptomyces tropicalis]|uniref:TetR/AcrR family transcriptional regulator n=1 Tax=Streptomyces tropicalis TaxID=3034234 RepID=A0ABT6AD64_9ACTN|nr:TetR/AcrR family transcriptional regulator [Streptomyces tropicalis]MDF3302593.1 TetR/AcrR family transcriptional regulator [Streptomyces tropicalis]